MTVIIKPIVPPQYDKFADYRIFDDVADCNIDEYPIIKILHKSQKRYVMMRVPDDCYAIFEKE